MQQCSNAETYMNVPRMNCNPTKGSILEVNQAYVQMMVMGVVIVLLGCLSALVANAPAHTRLQQWRVQIYTWWRIIPGIILVWLAYPVGLYLLVGLIGWLSWKELFADPLHCPQWMGKSLGWQLMLVHLAWLAAAPYALVFGLIWVVSVALVICKIDGKRLLWCLYAAQGAGLSFLICIHHNASGQSVGRAWFLYLVLLTAFNDVAQFVFGKLYGQHKLAQSISPHKTWQGVAGGAIASVLISVTLAHSLNLCSVATAAALGVLLSTVGVLGDLFFSMAKRRLGIKDFSNLLPGHGGMLDRVDSLVFTAPVLWFTQKLMNF
jgi:phosphatidate cytidylyltransferase